MLLIVFGDIYPSHQIDLALSRKFCILFIFHIMTYVPGTFFLNIFLAPSHHSFFKATRLDTQCCERNIS